MTKKVRRKEKVQTLPFKKSKVICMTITKYIQIKILGVWVTKKTYEIEKWIDNKSK